MRWENVRLPSESFARRNGRSGQARTHRRGRHVGALEHAQPLGGGHEHPAAGMDGTRAREMRIRMKLTMVTRTCCVVQVGVGGGSWCRFHLLPGDVADKDPVPLVVLVHQRVVAADHRLLHLLRLLDTRRGGRVPLSCAVGETK